MGCSELNGKPYKPSPGLAAAMPLGHFRIILINTFKNNRYQARLTGYVVRIFYLLKATSNKRLKQQATSNKHVAGCQVLALDNSGL